MVTTMYMYTYGAVRFACSSY